MKMYSQLRDLARPGTESQVQVVQLVQTDEV